MGGVVRAHHCPDCGRDFLTLQRVLRRAELEAAEIQLSTSSGKRPDDEDKASATSSEKPAS
jgi:hypothetical protein